MADEIKKLKFKQNISSLQIEVVSLESLTKINKNYLITPHRTDFYHIFLFENCQTTHLVDFEQIKIQPFTLLFIDKNRVHQFDSLLNYNGQVLIFTDDFFTDTKFLRTSILFNDLSNQKTITLLQQDFERFKNICENITEELVLPDDSSKYPILKNHLHNFLLLAEREKSKQGFEKMKKGADLDYTILFRDLLEVNFTKLKSVKEYLSLICISEKRLLQATTKILGKTPKEIISERIILEAKRLLAHTNESVKEIGFLLGFDEPTNFIKFFKAIGGLTPVEFRNQFYIE